METRQACSFSVRLFHHAFSGSNSYANGPALVVALGARRIWVFVIPEFGRGLTLGEEEEIGADTGVGIEYAVGQSDDRMQVAISEESFLDARFHALTKEGAIGQHESGPTAGL